ncbi:endonuclease/exonuclease/phosphatase family protein [Streptomyces sp. NPDC059740]|uniref:endonuclease/exonuclease/phosphatase family protein n=1 Tax=Streptomyces sp. NPDC059740 TaxID=3346926 RepID=UPI003653E4DE
MALATAVALAAGLTVCPPATAAGVRIHDVQGTTRLSPLAGTTVSEVPGVVTAVRSFGSSRGFWIQDPAPDDDPATSEGLFVFTGSTTPKLSVGDAVLVSGRVSEYYPGGASAGGQSLTELSGATWTVTSSGNPLPAAAPVNAATLPARWAPDTGGGSLEPLPLRPARYALDRYESLEGMRVAVSDAPVVGPSNTYHELWVTADPARHRTARGGVLYDSYRDPNAARLKVTSLLPLATDPFPTANVGDELTGTTSGPLDYDSFGGYTLAATAVGGLAHGTTAPEVTRPAAADQLSVATYNVENLSPKNPQAKFDRLASALVTNLASPDIVSLEEVQDDDGATDDGVVGAGATLTKLTDAIAAAGGPAYRWRSIDPVDDSDGGEPGGNIRNVFLYNPERVSFTDVPGGTATTGVSVTGTAKAPALTASPGRIAPTDAAWKDSRKPLVGQFSFRGKPVFVVACHFNSKGGDQGLDSRFQPPARSSETQRVAQARLVNGFVRRLLDVSPKADMVVAGDLNDYQFSPALGALTAGGALTDLVRKLPRDERYGYVYNGNSQVLDHILTGPGLHHPDYDIVHVNAEFADQASDHDPQVVRVRP